MEENLEKAIQVVVVCTQGYLRRATAANTGVGYERMIINRAVSEDLLSIE